MPRRGDRDPAHKRTLHETRGVPPATALLIAGVKEWEAARKRTAAVE